MIGKRHSGIILAILSLLFILLLSSCAQKNPLEGRWRSTGFDEELGGEVSLIYHFSADGSIFIEPEEGAGFAYSIPFGTYSVSGESVEIVSNDVKSENTFTVSGDTLVLTDAEGNSSEFTRVK